MSGETGVTKSSVHLKQQPKLAGSSGQAGSLNRLRCFLREHTDSQHNCRDFWPTGEDMAIYFTLSINQDYSCLILLPCDQLPNKENREIPLNYLFLSTVPEPKLSDPSFWLSSCPPCHAKKQICCHCPVATPKGTGMNTAKATFSPNQGDEEVMSYFQLVSPFWADSAKLLSSDKALAIASLGKKKPNTTPKQNKKQTHKQPTQTQNHTTTQPKLQGLF